MRDERQAGFEEQADARVVAAGSHDDQGVGAAALDEAAAEREFGFGADRRQAA